MPFLNCVNCGTVVHVRIRSDLTLDQWKRRFGSKPYLCTKCAESGATIEPDELPEPEPRRKVDRRKM